MPHVAEEHRACREDVAVFDQSSFSKAMLVGPDAEKFLQRICAGNMAKAPGRLTYTQILNAKGGIESDLTIARIEEDKYYVVTGTAMATRDFNLIEKRIQDETVSLINISSQYGVLGLMGPKSRELLASITEASLDGADFPFGHVKEIMVAGAPVRAMRMSFVGELGWELHIPSEYMQTVYDRLKQAGEAYGLKDAGYRALDGLRIEKRMCVWGAEVTPDENPFEAGIGFAVDFKKKVDFVGRAALEGARNRPLGRRLVSFTVENKDVVLLGRETIYRNGVQVGYLTSGGFGHSVGMPVGLGYVSNKDGVDKAFIEQGEYELEVAGVLTPAKVYFHSVYDPSSEKVRR
jgi:4-methylaminobutanoate oxidase (formaldehyde-forming)